MAVTAVNPLDHIAIQNVIARYCEGLDTKIYDLLDKVFVPDATASYPFNPDLKGADAVKDAVLNRYIYPACGQRRDAWLMDLGSVQSERIII